MHAHEGLYVGFYHCLNLAKYTRVKWKVQAEKWTQQDHTYDSHQWTGMYEGL